MSLSIPETVDPLRLVETVALLTVAFLMGISQFKAWFGKNRLTDMQQKLTELELANQRIQTLQKEIAEAKLKAEKDADRIKLQEEKLDGLRKELDDRPKPEAVKAMMDQAAAILAGPLDKLATQIEADRKSMEKMLVSIDKTLGKICDMVTPPELRRRRKKLTTENS